MERETAIIVQIHEECLLLTIGARATAVCTEYAKIPSCHDRYHGVRKQCLSLKRHEGLAMRGTKARSRQYVTKKLTAFLTRESGQEHHPSEQTHIICTGRIK